jgi:peptide/nickel transport system permease protein
MTTVPVTARKSAPFLTRLTRNRLALASLLVFLVVTVICVAAPWLAPYRFDAIDLASRQQGPSASHWLGTDELGRDLLTRMLYGGRISISIGVFSAVLATALGTVVGSLAGYFGSVADEGLMRFTDVAYAIPALPLLIVLSSFWPATLTSMAIIIGCLSWMGTARTVRSEVLSIREQTYVEAARSIGAGHQRIIWRHILPNALSPIVVGVTLAVGNAIIIESSLSFLGLGVQPPTPTWGNMLQDGRSDMYDQPWMTLFPGLAILIVVLCVNYFGDGLQEALSPKENDG